VSLDDPTLDGTSCIEKDMAPTEIDPDDPGYDPLFPDSGVTRPVTPEDLMITFRVPDGKYHYVKGIVI
jgi:hypothetical protein